MRRFPLQSPTAPAGVWEQNRGLAKLGARARGVPEALGWYVARARAWAGEEGWPHVAQGARVWSSVPPLRKLLRDLTGPNILAGRDRLWFGTRTPYLGHGRWKWGYLFARWR